MKSEPGTIGLSRPDNRQETLASGMRDNFSRGTVGEFLSDRILGNSALSVVSAYFTILLFVPRDMLWMQRIISSPSRMRVFLKRSAVPH